MLGGMLTQGLHGALVVAGGHPFVDDLTDFAEGGEQVRIEDRYRLSNTHRAEGARVTFPLMMAA